MLLVLNQSPLSTIFAIVQFPGGAKFVLSGDPLYYTRVSYELCKYYFLLTRFDTLCEPCS